MKNLDVDKELFDVIDNIAKSQGLQIVDLTKSINGDSLNIGITIYKEEGISTDDCSALHKAIIVKLEVMYDKKIFLDISSPGIYRIFKHLNEFAIFINKNVAILYKGEPDWITGVIVSATENSVVLSDNRCFNFENILKAKLI